MNEKSEQIDSRLNILVDADQPLAPSCIEATILSSLSCGLARKETLEVDGRRHSFIAMHAGNEKHALLYAAVTFLGGNGNHPIFKKRIQLKSWFKPATKALSKIGYHVHFLGVYHFSENIVFVDFAIETYLRRKMHNSSAFVYVNDLYRAMKDGIATRVDLHGNTITTIRKNAFESFIKGSDNAVSDDSLFTVFSNFNSFMPFKLWVKGTDAIKEMQQEHWPKWRETEWAGWFLEYKFSKFLMANKTTEIVYQGNVSKKKGALDFDLLFPIHKFYGDLKASDIKQKESLGNDSASLFDAIDSCDRFWYVIYEHETVKDKDCNHKLTRYRYELLLSIDGKAKSPLSYAKKMKNRVNFRRMMILELNRANCGDLLSEFHQGHQPDGSARAPKVKITKRNVENYQVFHYEA